MLKYLSQRINSSICKRISLKIMEAVVMNDRPPLYSFSMADPRRVDDEWYDWCVFLDPRWADFDDVVSVEYILHSTFPDPHRTISNAKECFALYTAGWGEFEIYIRVHLRNGAQREFNFGLHLEADNWPKKDKPNQFPDSDSEQVYNCLTDSQYKWRKFSTILVRTRLPAERVTKALSVLYELNLARKAHYMSIDKEELWGPTSVVGISPRKEWSMETSPK
jgi:transcription initiation factor IIF auxiliary subunit